MGGPNRAMSVSFDPPNFLFLIFNAYVPMLLNNIEIQMLITFLFIAYTYNWPTYNITFALPTKHTIYTQTTPLEITIQASEFKSSSILPCLFLIYHSHMYMLIFCVIYTHSGTLVLNNGLMMDCALPMESTLEEHSKHLCVFTSMSRQQQQHDRLIQSRNI